MFIGYFVLWSKLFVVIWIEVFLTRSRGGIEEKEIARIFCFFFATSRLRVRVHIFPSCLMMARRSVLSAVRRSITARRRRGRGWIAERLAMGTRGYLNPLLDRRRKLGGE